MHGSAHARTAPICPKYLADSRWKIELRGPLAQRTKRCKTACARTPRVRHRATEASGWNRA